MEYYEQEFLDYEDYLLLTGHLQLLSNMFQVKNPHATSDLVLTKYERYQKFEKSER